MKHIILTILALCGLVTAWADEPVSGEYYRICSVDGTSALSNGGSASNNVVLRMCALDEEDQGQVWQLTEANGYWQIKSSVGNVCIDNPSEAHATWNNQVLQWQTSGGNNQKWTFEAVDEDFYLIPYESSDRSKSYGYDANGYVTYQAKGNEGTRFVLKKVSSEPLEPMQVNGYYTLQPVSVYPDFNYKSEGRFLAFNAKGISSLAEAYTYAECCLQLTTDADGTLHITLPQSKQYVYNTGSGVKAANNTDESKLKNATFSLYANEKQLTLNTLVAFTPSNVSPTAKNSTIRAFIPISAGTSVNIQSKPLENAQCFRLVAVPAGEQVAALAQEIAEAKALLDGLSEELATALNAAVSLAQSECDYPYITPAEAVAQTQQLKDVVEKVKSSSAAASTKPTGINEASSKAPTVQAHNGVITVTGAQAVKVYNAAGHVVPQGVRLPSGVYVVVADGTSIKVSL